MFRWKFSKTNANNSLPKTNLHCKGEKCDNLCRVYKHYLFLNVLVNFMPFNIPYSMINLAWKIDILWGLQEDLWNKTLLIYLYISFFISKL